MLKRFVAGITDNITIAAARGILRGIIMSQAQRWDMALILQLVLNSRGVNELVPQAILPSLRFQGEKYPSLKEIPVQQFLQWIQDGNPALFAEIIANPQVMDWLLKGWDAGVKELFRTEKA